MQKTEAADRIIPGSSGMPTPLRTILTLIAPIVVIFALYMGFIFLREQGNASQMVKTVVAIVWGIGGAMALFYVANEVVELLPNKWMARIQPFIFVGPAILLLAWYLAIPALRTLQIALTDQNTGQFTLENFRDVFTQRIMIEAWTNNLLWMLIGTTLTVAFGLLIAVLADRSRFERAAKSLIFMPMAISMVGAGVIWKFVYDFNPNLGLLNATVTAAGGQPQAWLTLLQPWNNLFLILVLVWMQTGYAMVLLSAAIKGLSEEMLEAARVDGANEFAVFFRIILPNISGTLLTVVTTIIIFTLKLFDIVMIMTGGQFGTEVIGVRFYREMFVNGNAGSGSAIAIVLLLAVVPIMLYNLRQFSQRDTF